MDSNGANNGKPANGANGGKPANSANSGKPAGAAKKELLARYKGRETVGGVYAIKNVRTGKMLVGSSTDMQGAKNRFAFSQQTGSCVYLKLKDDWDALGGGLFAFETLEEAKKGESQPAADFAADIAVLKELWLEKLSGKDMY